MACIYGCIGKDLEYSKRYTPKKKQKKNMELNWKKSSLKAHFHVPLVIFQFSRLFFVGPGNPVVWSLCQHGQAGTFARRTSKTAASRNSREGTRAWGNIWNLMVFSG